MIIREGKRDKRNPKVEETEGNKAKGKVRKRQCWKRLSTKK